MAIASGDAIGLATADMATGAALAKAAKAAWKAGKISNAHLNKVLVGIENVTPVNLNTGVKGGWSNTGTGPGQFITTISASVEKIQYKIIGSRQLYYCCWC